MATPSIVPITVGIGLLAGAAFAADTEVFDVGKELGRAAQGRSVVNVPLLRKTEYSVNAVAVKDEIPTHRHENDNHVLYVVSGQGTARVGADSIPLEAGVIVHIPRGIEHRITAQGGQLRLVDFVQHSADQGVKEKK